MIEHVGGKYWHPSGGDACPKNNTEVVLHGDRHDRAKFKIQFGEEKAGEQGVVEMPNLRLSV